MFSPDAQFSRYRQLVSHLAQSACAAAGGVAPADAGAGALASVLPAARRLMGDASRDATGPVLSALSHLSAGAGRLVTLTGQHRPVYEPLAVHLVVSAVRAGWASLDGDEASAVHQHVTALSQGIDAVALSRQTVSLVLWQALCRLEIGALLDQHALVQEASGQVAQALAESPTNGALHAQHSDDQLDHWTYRELSGLHALANLALQSGRDDWWDAVERIVRFHIEHTQPDYTTYEPWGVHAFLRWPGTMVFADQQLHDTETNLHVGGERVALLPALLLADAAAALATDDYLDAMER